MSNVEIDERTVMFNRMRWVLKSYEADLESSNLHATTIEETIKEFYINAYTFLSHFDIYYEHLATKDYCLDIIIDITSLEAKIALLVTQKNIRLENMELYRFHFFDIKNEVKEYLIESYKNI